MTVEVTSQDIVAHNESRTPKILIMLIHTVILENKR